MKIVKSKLLRVILGSFALVAVFLPSVALAEEPTWGPERATYTMQVPANEPVFNSITNNDAEIGDERKFVRIARIPESCVEDCDIVNVDFKQSVELEPNAIYMVYIYYHNNAASNLNGSGAGIAKNVTMYSSYPDRIIGQRGEVEAKISYNKITDAANTQPSSVWAKAYFNNNTNKDIALKYVTGSGKHYSVGVKNSEGKIVPIDDTTNDAEKETKIMPVADYLFDYERGVKLGFGDWYNGQYFAGFGSGLVLGCEPYQGAVTYVLRSYEVNATVEKQVSVDNGETYSDAATILPGETVKFRLRVKNTGTAEITNPVLKDTLPEGLTLVGTPIISAEGQTANLTTSLNYNLNTIGVGRTVDVIFDAKAGLDYDCEGTELVNKARLVYDGISADGGVSREDSAKVTVRKSAEECREKEYKAGIIKEVSTDGGKTYSETASIVPGATVRYRLTIENVGRDDIRGLQVKDVLPSGMSLVEGSVKNTIDGATEWANLDNTLEYVFNLPENVKMYIVYDAKADGKDFDCDGKDLVNVAEIRYFDGDSKETKTVKNDRSKVVVAKSAEECRKKEIKAEILKEISVDGGKTYGDVAAIIPGATVRYRLTITNTGEDEIKGLQVKDELPKGMTLVEGSEKNSVEGATEWKALDGTLNHVFNLPVGQKMYIVYDAKAGDKKEFNCAGVELTNIAEIAYFDGSSKEGTVKKGQAKVTVKKEAKDCKYEALVTKEISVDNGKTFVASATILPGAKIRYRLTINNTGAEDLAGVDVKDVLPKGMTLVKGSVKVTVKGSDQEADYDDTLEYKLSSVAAGGTVYITYEAQAGKDGFDCTGKELVNTVKISYIDGDTKEGVTNEDEAKVIVKKADAECKTCKTDPDMEGCKELPKTGPMEITIFSIIMAGIAGGTVYLIFANRTLKRVTAEALNVKDEMAAPAKPITPVEPIAPAEPIDQVDSANTDETDKFDGGALNA